MTTQGVWRATWISIACAIAFAATMPAAGGQTIGSSERFTATAVNLPRGGTQQLEIAVNRWSSDAERDKLLNTLLSKGPEKLLDVLRDVPKVGYIRSTSSIGWDLHYARHNPLPDGGECVVVATDRPISFWEQANQPRTIDYPFTIVELHLKADGVGEGKMSFATKIVADKESGNIVLENYGIQPVLLQAVKREHGGL